MSNSDIMKASCDTRFRNKTMIITGAGGNFGRVGCIYFAKRGANIAAMDNNENALNETLNEILADTTITGKIKGYTCDVTNAESVENTVTSITKDFGRIDMLWNNAGYQGQIKPTLEYDVTDFANVMHINVTGMFIVLQSVAKRMASSGVQKQIDTINDGGTAAVDENSHPFSIVNTASVAALRESIVSLCNISFGQLKCYYLTQTFLT